MLVGAAREVDVSARGTAGVGAAGVLVAGFVATGCSGPTTRPVVQLAASPVVSASPAGKHYAHGTGHLRVTITPTTGGVGTVVSIVATGCGDPDGRNHAVSFNPGFASTLQAARAHYRAGVIPSHLIGQTLTATYAITAEDGAAAADAEVTPPKFYVQCSDDLADANFLITR